MADIVWNIEPGDIDKTIDPGVHLSKICNCGSCENHQPKDAYGYLRFLPKGSTTGATIFIHDPAVYDVIEKTLASLSAEEKSGALAVLAQMM